VCNHCPFVVMLKGECRSRTGVQMVGVGWAVGAGGWGVGGGGWGSKGCVQPLPLCGHAQW
jgi:hypothetical protein